MAMESVTVTSVTSVTSPKCHACHAPLHRDIRRDMRGTPLKGGARCHACHAGLSVEDGGSGLVAAKPAPVAKMPSYRYADALIAWTPRSEADAHRSTVGQVKVGPYPDRTGWANGFACHGGAAEITGYPNKAAIAILVLRDFNRLVTEGLRVRVVHEALLSIEEYRNSIDETVPGANLCRRPRESNGVSGHDVGR